MKLTNTEILNWLVTTDNASLTTLWHLADETRQKFVGEAVHLRGLIEISNYCARECRYCGINVTNQNISRYRMTQAEILDAAKKAHKFGYGTVVLQSGEDYGLNRDFIIEVIETIKQATKLAVTLSLGERSLEDLTAWKKAGADRYLLRFETSDAELFKRIHPPKNTVDARYSRANADESRAKKQQNFNNLNNSLHPRITLLKALKAIGYEVGSGVMIGIPGQSYASLTEDIELFAKLDLDMIGVGPYLPHPETELGQTNRVKTNMHPSFVHFPPPDEERATRSAPDLDNCYEPGSQLNRNLTASGCVQVPNTELMTYKVIALTRLVCPEANIPSTTALATLNKTNGRELGLMRGANVVMPNLTPPHYRAQYTIYPHKACINDTAEACDNCMRWRIESIGRTLGKDTGARKKSI